MHPVINSHLEKLFFTKHSLGSFCSSMCDAVNRYVGQWSSSSSGSCHPSAWSLAPRGSKPFTGTLYSASSYWNMLCVSITTLLAKAHPVGSCQARGVCSLRSCMKTTGTLICHNVLSIFIISLYIIRWQIQLFMNKLIINSGSTEDFFSRVHFFISELVWLCWSLFL